MRIHFRVIFSALLVLFFLISYKLSSFPSPFSSPADPPVSLGPYPSSSFTCNRETTQCEFQHLCLNSDLGLIFISPNSSLVLPSILAPATSFEGWRYHFSPLWVHPDLLRREKVRIEVVENTVLVVAGSYAPFHLAHDVDSSLVPLEALLNRYNLPGKVGEKGGEEGSGKEVDLHLLTIGKFPSQNEACHKFPISLLGFSRLFGSGVKDIGASVMFDKYPIFDGFDAQQKDVLKGSTLCYPRVIMGLGDICSLCPNKPTAEDFRTLRNKILRHFHLPERPIEGRVVLLRRKEKRAIVNHDEVVEYLRAFPIDLVVFAPEELSMEQQIVTLAEASVFIAPHGNGNAHIHFLAEGALFVEVFGWGGFERTFFKAPALLKGLRYRTIDCTSAECEKLKAKDHPRNDNIFLDLAALDAILKEEGILNPEVAQVLL